MGFKLALMGQEVIETTVEPVLVDRLFAQLQQITQRRAAIPVLGNVQFTGRLAEPGCEPDQAN